MPDENGLNCKKEKDEVEKEDGLIKEDKELLENGTKHQFTEETSGNPGHVSQILVVLGISFGCFIHGTCVVWPIVLAKIISDSSSSQNSTVASGINLEDGAAGLNLKDSSTGFSIDRLTDVPWIVSIYVLGNFIGSVVSAPLNNTIGRKWTCLFGIGVTFALSFVLVFTAQQVHMLYLSRVLMGIALGVSTTVSTIYIQDISTPDIRGSLGAIPAVTGALGVFMFQILNAFLSWRHLNILCACLSVPYCLFLILLPESPVFLLSRKREGSARAALKRLRGSDWDVGKELEDIQANLDAAGKNKSKNRLSFSAFTERKVLFPVFISFMLIFLMNMSGISVIMSYTVQIFQSANSSIDAFTATVYLGVALLVSNLLTVLLAHKLPRRLMLMISSLGIAATLAVMGLTYQIKDWETDCQNRTIQPTENTESECSYGNLGWLPLATLMMYIFVFNLGFGAMVFITASEILPPHARELGMSLVISLNCPISFLISYSFPFLLEAIKGQGCFWLYSAVSLLGFCFIWLVIPETKGRTDQQIQEQLNNKKSETETNKQTDNQTDNQKDKNTDTLLKC